jgi:hypothetical protein
MAVPPAWSVSATVQNNTAGNVGGYNQAITGIDLCFISTVFKDVNGNPVAQVAGDGPLNPDSTNPLGVPPLGLQPIYNLSQSLFSGATSVPRTITLHAPGGALTTATTATMTVIVRANTTNHYAPTRLDWYLTTLAGKFGTSGYLEGPVGQALFAGEGLEPLFRDNLGDLLVPDYNNSRVRSIFQGQVSTFAGDGTTSTNDDPNACWGPSGLARDSWGNVYIAEYGGNCISLVHPGGGKTTVIAGRRSPIGASVPIGTGSCTGPNARFNQPSALAVKGNLVYVCDAENGRVKLLTYSPTAPNTSAGRFNPLYWTVTDITGKLSLDCWRPGVALDAAGNVYVTSRGQDATGEGVWLKLATGSTWTKIAGNPANNVIETDGTGYNASFANWAEGIAVDTTPGYGYVYVADLHLNLRRLVHTTPGLLTDPTKWTVDTPVPAANAPVDGFTGTGKVFNLRGVTCTRDGTLYLTDETDVRRLDRSRN